MFNYQCRCIRTEQYCRALASLATGTSSTFNFPPTSKDLVIEWLSPSSFCSSQKGDPEDPHASSSSDASAICSSSILHRSSATSHPRSANLRYIANAFLVSRGYPMPCSKYLA